MEFGRNQHITRKQISVNMVMAVLAHIINIIIPFFLTPFLINQVGKELYSFYPLANTIVSYVSVLSNSLNSIAARFLTIALVRGDEDDVNRYFSSTLLANLILSCILLVPMMLIVLFLDKLLEVPINYLATIRVMFSMVFSAAIITIISSVFGIATFAKNRVDLRSLRELVVAFLRMGLFYVFFKYLTPSIVYVGIVTLIVATFNILIQFFYTKKLLPKAVITKKYISCRHIRSIFHSSVWSSINSLGNILLAGMTLMLANMLYGVSASGPYSIVQVIPQFMSGIISMLVGVFFPVIVYRYGEGDISGLVEQVSKAQIIIGVVCCSVLSVYSAFSEEFFTLWIPGENANYLAMLSSLSVLPHFFVSSLWILTVLNVTMNKVMIPAIMNVLCGVLNIVIAIAIKHFTVLGVEALCLVCGLLQIVNVVIFIPLYVCKKLSIRWYSFYPTMLKLLICSFVVYRISLLVKRVMFIQSWVYLFVFGVICGVLSICLMTIIAVGPKQCLKWFYSWKA